MFWSVLCTTGARVTLVTPVVAIIVVFAGAMFLRALARRRGNGEKRGVGWAPLVALVAGPILAVAWWAVWVYWLHPDQYRHDQHLANSDRQRLLRRSLYLGVIIGIVVAAAITVVRTAAFATIEKVLSKANKK